MAGSASALVFKHGAVPWVVVFVFYIPAVSDFLKYSRGRLAPATAQIDALPTGLFACVLLGRLAVDLGD